MIIGINNLQLQTEIGILKSEQNRKQDIVVNIEFEIDGEKAMSADKIENTVDYYPLTNKITEEIEKGKFNLVEYLAGVVLEIVMDHDERILNATVTIDKLDALEKADSASVTVSAER